MCTVFWNEIICPQRLLKINALPGGLLELFNFKYLLLFLLSQIDRGWSIIRLVNCLWWWHVCCPCTTSWNVIEYLTCLIMLNLPLSLPLTTNQIILEKNYMMTHKISYVASVPPHFLNPQNFYQCLPPLTYLIN